MFIFNTSRGTFLSWHFKKIRLLAKIYEKNYVEKITNKPLFIMIGAFVHECTSDDCITFLSVYVNREVADSNQIYFTLIEEM